ncbi:MAG: hypothetical protein ABSA40_11005 [Candidatus Dormibacteria bacterium]
MAAARPAPRSLTPAVLAVALAVGLAAAAALHGGLDGERASVTRAVATLGGIGALTVAVAVAGGWPRAIAGGIALLAAAYAVTVLGDGSRLDLTAPLVGALLVLTAELAHTACEWRGPHAVNRAAEVGRWLRLTGVVALGAVIGLGALAITSASGAGPPAVLLAGGAAAVLLLIMVTVLHRQA